MILGEYSSFWFYKFFIYLEFTIEGTITIVKRLNNIMYFVDLVLEDASTKSQ